MKDNKAEKKYTVAQQNPEHLHFKSLCRQIFILNKKGQELMDILKKKFLEAPVCPHSQQPAYGYYREGQNEIIRLLDTMSKELETK